MKKYFCSLVSILVLTSLLVAGWGAYIKFEMLAPYCLYQDKNIIELPFLLLTDNALGYMLQLAAQPTQPPTEPPTQAPTAVPTEAPAEDPTEIPTEAPTEAPTEPVIVPVEESWFDDALFIGNSLTVGLRDYAPLGEADYFCSIGLNVFDIGEEWARVDNNRYVQLRTMLQSNIYGKIYLHFGTNECGYPVDTILPAYQDLIDLLREYQPEAQIIVQAMMSFGSERYKRYIYMTPETAANINVALEAFALENGLHFLDFNPEVVDEDGALPYEWSNDGCHPTFEGYRQWSQWLWEQAPYLGIE